MKRDRNEGQRPASMPAGWTCPDRRAGDRTALGHHDPPRYIPPLILKSQEGSSGLSSRAGRSPQSRSS